MSSNISSIMSPNSCNSDECKRSSDVMNNKSLAIFSLPWYRLFNDVSDLTCLHEPVANYTHYMIFCLKTRITDTIRNVLGSDTILDLISSNKGNKAQLNMVFTRYPIAKPNEIYSVYQYPNTDDEMTIDIDFDITPNLISEPDSILEFNSENISCTQNQRFIIENKINEILTIEPEACLLISPTVKLNSIDNVHIPTDWIKQVLPFVQLDSKYRPFYTNDGYHVILSDLETSEDIEGSYLQIYLMLYDNVTKKLLEMYNDGYIPIFSPNKNLIDNWALIPIDDEGMLYKPNWKDLRITNNLVEFLTNLISGDKNIRIYIGRDDTQRHFIAQALNKNSVKFSFMGSYIKIPAIDISNTKKICTIIDNAKSQNNRSAKLNLKNTNDPTPINSENCIQYQTQNLLRSYTISCLEEI